MVIIISIIVIIVADYGIIAFITASLEFAIVDAVEHDRFGGGLGGVVVSIYYAYDAGSTVGVVTYDTGKVVAVDHTAAAFEESYDTSCGALIFIGIAGDTGSPLLLTVEKAAVVDSCLAFGGADDTANVCIGVGDYFGLVDHNIVDMGVGADPKKGFLEVAEDLVGAVKMAVEFLGAAADASEEVGIVAGQCNGGGDLEVVASSPVGVVGC